jgi:hypothetical protein
LIGLEGWSCRSEDGGPEWKLVVDGMRADLKKRCARWIIGRFAAQAEFLRVVLRDEEFGNRYEELFLNIKGPVWVEFRAEFLKVLSRKDDSVIQNNAYDLLDCLVYHATEKKRWEGPAKAILSSKDFSVSVWNACMVQPLNPRAIGSLRGAHKYLTDLGMECKTPAWWNRIVQGLPPLEPQLP